MASVTSSAVSISSFTGGLKATAGTTHLFTTVKMPPSSSSPLSKFAVKASLKEAGLAAVVAVTASAMLTGNALAIDVKLGADSGELVFEPKEFTVASGEKISFSNNAGFPHNIVFDEDEVPAGVDVSKISMSDEDYLNAPGETYSVTLTEKGTYSFYCAPHQGAGMVGKVTVN